MVDLKQIAIFSALNKEDAESVRANLIPEIFKKKQVIFTEGDPSEWLYIVIKGKVKITKLSRTGREIILEIISPMDFFGGIAVIRGFPYPANAVAMQDTEVLKISKANLKRILDRYPSLIYCMAMKIGDRVKGSHESLKNMAAETVEARIAAMLIKLSEQSGIKKDNSILIDMKVTKQDIAEMTGTTVESSIRTMSRLKKQGVIEEKEGRISIKNMEKLKALCS